MREGAVQVVELLLHQDAGDGVLHKRNHAARGCVSAVCCTERVVDEDGCPTGLHNRLSERGVVLFFLVVEARVLEEQHASFFELGYGAGDGLAHAVLGHQDLNAQLLGHACCQRRQAHSLLFFGRLGLLGTSQVTATHDLGAQVDENSQRWQRLNKPCSVNNLGRASPLAQRTIEIGSD